MSKISDKQLFSRALLDLIFPTSVLARLDQLTAFQPSTTARSSVVNNRTQDNAMRHSRKTHVSIVERVTPYTMTVRWSDSTSGRYDEQLWRTAKARTESICALTGLPIRPHDEIFKPVAHGRMPFNVNWMILASEAERFLGAPVKLATFPKRA